jgi:hypothetical protein
MIGIRLFSPAGEWSHAAIPEEAMVADASGVGCRSRAHAAWVSNSVGEPNIQMQLLHAV